MIPWLTNQQWIQADVEGVYLGQCTQFCGVQHAYMDLEVIAQSHDEFQKWQDAQRKTVATVSATDVDAGKKIFLDQCAGCHTVRGTEAVGCGLYNFAVIPLVASRHPLWEDRLDEGAGRSSLDQGYLLMEGRETLGTTPLDAIPDVILKMPEDSYTPFFLGLFTALAFVGLLLHSRDFTVLMALACGLSLMVWLWPRKALGFSVCRT